MSISFAPARCRDWSFRVLGSECHLLCAVPRQPWAPASSGQQCHDGWASGGGGSKEGPVPAEWFNSTLDVAAFYPRFSSLREAVYRLQPLSTETS
jgi:hypothetical protein